MSRDPVLDAGVGVHRDVPPAEALRAPRTPVASGGIAGLGLLLAALVLAAGLAGLHDAAVAAGLLGAPSWVAWAVRGLDGVEPAAWLVVMALKPRPRRVVSVRAATGVLLRPNDLRALAQAAARDVDGVTSVHASATRRGVVVRVNATGDDGIRAQGRARDKDPRRRPDPPRGNGAVDDPRARANRPHRDHGTMEVAMSGVGEAGYCSRTPGAVAVESASS